MGCSKGKRSLQRISTYEHWAWVPAKAQKFSVSDFWPPLRLASDFFFFKVCLPNLYSLESLFSLLPIIIFSNTEQILSSKCHNAWSLCILKYLITYLHVLALTVMCVKKSLRNHSSLLCKMEIFTSGEAAERIKWDHIAKELSAIHGVRYELRFVKYVYFLLFVIIVLQWKEFFCSVFCPHFVVLPKNSHLHLAHLYLIKTLRIK